MANNKLPLDEKSSKRSFVQSAESGMLSHLHYIPGVNELPLIFFVKVHQPLAYFFHIEAKLSLLSTFGDWH